MCSRSFVVQKRGAKSVARYDLGDSLGSGSFGAVMKATDRISNASRAWKAMRKGSSARFSTALNLSCLSRVSRVSRVSLFIRNSSNGWAGETSWNIVIVIDDQWLVGSSTVHSTWGKENDTMFRKEAVTMSVLDHPHICILALPVLLMSIEICGAKRQHASTSWLELSWLRPFIRCDRGQWALLFCHGTLWGRRPAALPAGLQNVLHIREFSRKPYPTNVLCHALYAWPVDGTFWLCCPKCSSIRESFRFCAWELHSQASRSSPLQVIVIPS